MNSKNDITHTSGSTQQLTDEQLNKLSTGRLLNLRRMVVGIRGEMWKYTVDENDCDRATADFPDAETYGERIRTVLKTRRDHVPRKNEPKGHQKKGFKNGHKQKLVRVKYSR